MFTIRLEYADEKVGRWLTGSHEDVLRARADPTVIRISIWKDSDSADSILKRDSDNAWVDSVREYVITYREPYQATDSPDRGIRITAVSKLSAIKKFRELYPNADIIS